MVFAAIAAVICANTDTRPSITLETRFVCGAGQPYGQSTVNFLDKRLPHSDFFLLVGIELKYEMTVGELKNPRGLCFPCWRPWAASSFRLHLPDLFNHAGAHNGWSHSRGTDIAFALGDAVAFG